mgnify:CR=1 FL=1
MRVKRGEKDKKGNPYYRNVFEKKKKFSSSQALKRRVGPQAIKRGASRQAQLGRKPKKIL